MTVNILYVDFTSWLRYEPIAKQFYINAGEAKGNNTLGTYKFQIILDDNNKFGPSKTIYDMTITIIRPENTLPYFVDETEV